MSKTSYAVIMWLYVGATALTFLGAAAITVFEVYVRWIINQNFSVLGGNGLAGLMILLGMQMLGLVWFSRSA